MERACPALPYTPIVPGALRPFSRRDGTAPRACYHLKGRGATDEPRRQTRPRRARPRWKRAGRDRDRSRLRHGRDARGGGGRQRRARGHHVLVLQPELPRAVRRRSGAIPGAGARRAARRRPCRHADLHVSHAPGDPPGRTRPVPQVRNGARAARAARRRRGAERRAGRHDPAVLGEPDPDRSRLCVFHGRDDRARPDAADRPGGGALDPARCWRRRWCSGAAGPSSCAAGSPS